MSTTTKISTNIFWIRYYPEPHYNNPSYTALHVNLDTSMNDHPLHISNLYRILMTTCIN